jgi:spore germination cell wall hydrolase CwlJ-like protein
MFGGSKKEKKDIKPGNIPNALKALIDTGETLGKSGDWVGALMKAGIQVALGEVPDVKSIASAITQVITSVRTPAMEGINAIRREIQGFAGGGLVSMNSSYSQNNTLLLERALEGTIKKRVDEALNSVRKEVNKRGPTGRDEMLQQNRQRAGSTGAEPGFGGVIGSESAGASVSKISMGDLSEQDIDALGRMIAAESQNQSKLGKAGVLSVILNRYRLAKAGKGYLPAGKTKDNVTIRDIIYAPNQFSPIKDGRFDKTSSGAGKKALADAISGGGNDPRKLKELLMKEMKLKESDAETVVRATAFSNPKSRDSRPFDTPEVAVGDHSFQESPYVRIKDFPGAIKADVKKEVTQYSGNLNNKFLKNLNVKLPGLTLGAQKYKASRDGGAREHAGRDYDLPDDGVFNSRIGGVVIFAGNVGGGYGNVIDIYNKDLNRTERIAEGTTILPGVEKGAVISPGQPVVKGTQQTGVIHYEIRKGKAGSSGSIEGTEDPDEFLNSQDYKDYISKVASGETKPKTELKVGSVLKSTKIGEGYVLTIRQGENNQKDYFLNGKKLSSNEVATYQKNHPNAFQVSEQKKESWLDKLNPTKIFKSSSTSPKPTVAGGGMSGGRGSGSSPGGMQGGGFISPSKSNVPNVSSRAYYENPTGSSMLAILPIETIQQVHVPMGGGTIFDSFPIAGLNNSNSSYGLMRG